MVGAAMPKGSFREFTDQFSISLPPRLTAELDRLARKKLTSRAAVVRELLAGAVAELRKQAKGAA